MADVGFGLEPPARRFRLDFIPVITERYFLLCRDDLVPTLALQKVLLALRDPAFLDVLRGLPGYDPLAAGRAMRLQDAYPVLTARPPASEA